MTGLDKRVGKGVPTLVNQKAEEEAVAAPVVYWLDGRYVGPCVIGDGRTNGVGRAWTRNSTSAG